MARDRTLAIAVNKVEERVIREVARREGHDAVSPFLRKIVLREVVQRARELEAEDHDQDGEAAA